MRGVIAIVRNEPVLSPESCHVTSATAPLASVISMS
jgi:hypothetical protein